MSATSTGSKNSPGTVDAPAVEIGATPDKDTTLERILARIPPIIPLPPAKGRCPWTGQSRTSLLELIAPCERNDFKPPVKAIYRRSHRHAVRGRWLIPSENLFRYLFSLSDDSATVYQKLAEQRRQKRQPE